MTLWDISVFDRLLNISNFAVLFSANVMVQTTILLSLGLGAAYILRNRGAAFQSLVLRTFLLAVLLCPVVSVIIEIAGINLITCEIPLASSLKHKTATPELQADHSNNNPDNVYHTGFQIQTGQHLEISSEKTSGTAGNRWSQVKQPLKEIRNLLLTNRAVIYMIFTAVWFLLFLMLFTRLIYGILYIHYIYRTAKPVNPSFTAACKSISDKLGIKAPPVLQSRLVKSPLLGGFFRPYILLAIGEHEDNLNTCEVFFHELSHLKRNDHVWNLLRHIGTLILPFQPLMWILSHWISETSDYVCDDYVMTFTKNHRNYAFNLYTLAQYLYDPGHELTAGVGFISFESPLRRRIKRILGGAHARALKTGMRFAVSTSILCFCATFLSGLIGFEGKHIVRNSLAYEVAAKTADILNLDNPFDIKPIIISYDPHERPDALKKIRERMTVPCFLSETESGSGKQEVIVKKPAAQDKSWNDLTSPNTQARSVLIPKPYSPSLTPHVRREDESLDAVLAELAIPETVADKDLSLHDYRFSGLKTAAFHTEKFVHSTPKRLNIVINYNFESADLTNPEQKKMSDFYRSLKKNKKFPVWSPDGKKIAFNDSDYGVWVVNADGGEPLLVYDNYYKLLYKNYNLHYGELQTIGFSPDGTELALRRYGIDTDQGTRVMIDEKGEVMLYYIENPLPVIESVNVKTGESRILAESAVTGSFSPGGRFFAYITEDMDSVRALWLLDMISDSRRELECSDPVNVCFSPDGLSLIVSEKETNGTGRIGRIMLGSGETETLFFTGSASLSDVSPDGRWILCTDTSSGSRQFFYDTQTGVIQDIITTEKKVSTWGKFSPDGSKICFNLMDKSGEESVWNIYIQDIRPLNRFSTDTNTSQPVPFSIRGNFPNPFNMATTIEFSIGERGHASLVIYNIMGQKVRELVSELMEPGLHHVIWDGTNDRGENVSTGMYVSKLTVENRVVTHKMMMMK